MSRKLNLKDVEFLRNIATELKYLSTKCFDTPEIIQEGRLRGLEKHRVMADRVESIANELEDLMSL